MMVDLDTAEIREFLVNGEAVLNRGDVSILFAHRLAGEPPIAEQAHEFIRAGIASGKKHLSIISSALCTGIHHQLPGMHDESHPRRRGESSPIVNRWAELEATCHSIMEAAPNVTLTVLRTPSVLTPDARQLTARLREGRFVWRFAGYDPPLQLLGIDDLSSAVATIVRLKLAGVYNVAPSAPISLRRALALAGCRSLPIPRFLARLAEKCCPLIKTSDMEQWRYPWTISWERLTRKTPWRPQWSSEESLRRFLGEFGKPQKQGVNTSLSESRETDPFGLDPTYIRFHRSLWLAFLEKFYWRMEIQGLENFEQTDQVILVGPHRGFMPFDGVILTQHVHHQLNRAPRFMIHPTLVKSPFISNLMRKFGGMIASRENAEDVLKTGQTLAIFPEGIAGAFKLYKEAYEIGRFGRPDYVHLAAKYGVPIVPFVLLGPAEVYPIRGRIRWRWFRKLTEWPFLPVVLCPFPLPSKWHLKVLPPVEPPPAEEATTEVCQALHRSIAQSIEKELLSMREKRPSVYAGSIF